LIRQTGDVQLLLSDEPALRNHPTYSSASDETCAVESLGSGYSFAFGGTAVPCSHRISGTVKYALSCPKKPYYLRF
jgi:hypothetical protein